MNKIIFKNGESPYINDTNLNKMQENAEKAINERKPTIELLTVSDTAPTQCNIGDKYYNTTTSKIYTAIATNMWATTGENPSNLYLYADLEHKELYYYDGTDFKSYGSGKKEVGYADEQLEGTEVILIEDSDFNGENSVELAKVEQNLTNNSENTVPSVKAVNNGIKTNITTGQEIATNEYIDGKRVYLKSFKITSLNDEMVVSNSIDYVKELRATVKDNSGGSWRTIPWVYNSNTFDKDFAGGILINSNGNVSFQAGVGLSAIAKGYVEVKYTKNT